jgi:hypothetical protein
MLPCEHGTPAPTFPQMSSSSQPRRPRSVAARSLGVSTSAAVGVALGAALVAGSARAAGGRLLVYLHIAVKQRAFQSLLQAGLPGITTTTVGRIGDFERVLAQGQDAVLTLPLVLGAQKLNASLRGHRGGSAEETYALVGTGNIPDPKRVSAVGALDILGRDGTNGFVRRMLGRDTRVERVTKVEDLLPLLQMQRVDAVLLPTRLFSELKSTSRLPLVQRELEARVGLPAAASVGPAGPTVLSAIGRLPRDVSKLLGVDEWR